jgi:hypothetical protein
LTLNGLHGVISQKTVIFITTAVRTSDPERNSLLCDATALLVITVVVVALGLRHG